MRGFRLGAVIAALAVGVVGCAGPEPATPDGAGQPGRFTPARVAIPDLGVDGPLIPLGRDAGGGWDEPDVHQPQLASWYDESVVPGDVGPAVILGHVNGPDPAGHPGGRPGVFSRLNAAQTGMIVEVTGTDGSVRRFRVTEVERVPKSKFPTSRVLGQTDRAMLTLVTCGGTFDTVRRSYRDSEIVTAMLE